MSYIANTSGGGSGTVTQIIAGTGLTGGTITTTGTIAVANPVAVVSTAGQGYFISSGHLSTMTGLTSVASNAAGAAQQVRAYQFVLPVTITVVHITILVTAAGAAGSTVTAGIYSADGNTKLIDSGTFDGTSATVQTKTIGAVTLTPGVYWYVHSASTQTTLTVSSLANPGGSVTNTIFNGQAVHMGTAANAATAGVLPPTLGAISAVGLNEMIAMFEP